MMAVDEASDQHSTEQWDEYSFVVSSTYRAEVMDRLATGPATPSQIATDAEVRITHVSRALQELCEQGLVDLLVSDDRKKGRVYGLNKDGRAVSEMLDEHGR